MRVHSLLLRCAGYFFPSLVHSNGRVVGKAAHTNGQIVALDVCGHLVASVGWDDCVKLWDLRRLTSYRDNPSSVSSLHYGGQEVGQVTLGYKSSFQPTDVKFGCGGAVLAVSDKLGGLYTVDTRSEMEVKALKPASVHAKVELGEDICYTSICWTGSERFLYAADMKHVDWYKFMASSY